MKKVDVLLQAQRLRIECKPYFWVSLYMDEKKSSFTLPRLTILVSKMALRINPLKRVKLPLML